MKRPSDKELAARRAAFLRGYTAGAGDVASFVRDCQPSVKLAMAVRDYADAVIMTRNLDALRRSKPSAKGARRADKA